MPRIGSIGRLMAAVGLIACALAIYRAWAGPSNFLGVLGPMAAASPVAVAGAIWTRGRARRFFVGFLAIGWAGAGSMLILPHQLVENAGLSLVVPLSKTPWPFRFPGPLVMEAEIFRFELMLWELGELDADQTLFNEVARRFPRGPNFFSVRLQGYFGLLQALPALLVGLIVALIPMKSGLTRPAPREASDRL